MIIFRRQIFRLLRTRNLVLAAVFIAFLYTLKLLNKLNGVEEEYKRDYSEDIHYFVPLKLAKIDWHNHTQIQYEKSREGLGEQGHPATIPNKEIQASAIKELFSVNGFNAFLSDMIPLNRSLPDIRHVKCKDRKYIKSLPSVSVVVPFHNEHWSTLLRTAYSVLYRSPDHLIKEIFLVDDASTKEFLKEKLEKTLAKTMPKVSVLRVPSRSGLITARLEGAKRATGDVIVFLDSHTEANVNWLPPLLEPIALNYKTVVCPYIDVIAYDTFEYRAQDEGARGAFDWELYYKRLPLLPKDLDNMPEPFESPVMAGGLFAISRAFFWELGGYDPGLDIWGGEQYELSFKIWQCGGRMLDAPCSRVGHIYRKFAPFPNPGHGDFVGKNYRRVAEVWMDEYAQYLYKRRPHYRDIDPGDLSHQVALRQRLRCKPFRWFITQVAFDLPFKYPPVEPDPFGKGRIRPVLSPTLCADALAGAERSRLQLRACAPDSGEQQFQLSWHKDIRSSRRTMCWDVPDARARGPVVLYGCHLSGGNQLWRYRPESKQLSQGYNDNCLDFDYKTSEIFVNKCDRLSQTQQWKIDHVNEKLLAQWDKIINKVTGPLTEYLEHIESV